MALAFPCSWKYLRAYVHFVRSASDWEFVVEINKYTQIFPFFCHFQLMSSQLAAEILVSNSQGHDLVLSTIKFHPISSVPALHVIQSFQQYSYSCCTPSFVPSANAISSLLPFVPRPVWKNIVQEQKHTQARLWSWDPGRWGCLGGTWESRHSLPTLPFVIPQIPLVHP